MLLFNLKFFLFRFKLAPKLKEPKPKTENVDPNGQREPKQKDDAKKPPKAGLLMRKITRLQAGSEGTDVS